MSRNGSPLGRARRARRAIVGPRSVRAGAWSRWTRRSARARTALQALSPLRRPLREDAALAVAVLQALEADRVARGAPVGLVLVHVVPHVGVGLLHPALEPIEHVLELPLLRPLVLQPLVVRDDHTARVAQDVG